MIDIANDHCTHTYDDVGGDGKAFAHYRATADIGSIANDHPTIDDRSGGHLDVVTQPNIVFDDGAGIYHCIDSRTCIGIDHRTVHYDRAFANFGSWRYVCVGGNNRSQHRSVLRQ